MSAQYAKILGYCKIAECENPRYSGRGCGRGMCGLHYQRWRKHGHTRVTRRFMTPAAECVAPSCPRDAYARGRCHKHWARLRKREKATANSWIATR